MKINKINRYKLCKLAYRIKVKLLPKALLEMFDAQGRKMHKYSTRYKNLLNIMKHVSFEFNKSFLCKSIWHYNTLSSNIKNAANLNDFIAKYKAYIF